MIDTKRLEDFGIRGMISPEDRLKQYQADCKALPRAKQAAFWLGVLGRDPQVRKLVELDKKINVRGRY